MQKIRRKTAKTTVKATKAAQKMKVSFTWLLHYTMPNVMTAYITNDIDKLEDKQVDLLFNRIINSLD
ncbi:MAG: hypothetical protein WCG93_13200 [Paludibacter sp.]